jgi:hypothetical protein
MTERKRKTRQQQALPVHEDRKVDRRRPANPEREKEAKEQVPIRQHAVALPKASS